MNSRSHLYNYSSCHPDVLRHGACMTAVNLISKTFGRMQPNLPERYGVALSFKQFCARTFPHVDMPISHLGMAQSNLKPISTSLQL